MLQHVVHGHHMRMAAQPGRAPGLPLVTGLGGVAEHDLLERDLAGESLVVGEPPMAHTATAEPVQQHTPAGDDRAHWWRVPCSPGRS
ncbi:hypothetical protein AB0I77_22125 [Streptomyces sp. NPDC050619]|uniref:hypothetical protein n=1 Tax=Streptomyces sp. NPDC050619 TaxID=3157214 RepID=UPI00343C555B